MLMDVHVYCIWMWAFLTESFLIWMETLDSVFLAVYHFALICVDSVQKELDKRFSQEVNH